MPVRTFKAAIPTTIFLIAFSLLLWLAGRVPVLKAHFTALLTGIPLIAVALAFAWNRHAAEKRAVEAIRAAGIDDKGETPLRTDSELIDELRSTINLHRDTPQGHHPRQPE